MVSFAAEAELQDSRSKTFNWWSHFRYMHSYGVWLRLAKQASALARGLRQYGIRPACYKVKAASIESNIVGDGDVLRATLLLPIGLDGPFPCILMRTPYGRKSEFGQAFLASRGYAVLVQDTRGRFSSDGQFVPVQHEREDGPSTVNWIRQQPWCNGKVGVTGASYLGFTAWACCDGADVDAIVPVITQSSVKSAVFNSSGAVSFELVVLWFYLVVHLMSSTSIFGVIKKFLKGQWERTVKRALEHVPVSDVDKILLGYKHDFLQKGLAAHSDPSSSFWDDKDRLCTFAKKAPPCHILTGWYDFFLEGALQDYEHTKQHQSSVRLTIGPYSHWGFLGSSRLYFETMLSWFDTHLMENPPSSTDSLMPVKLYILGFGWHRFPEYPPPSVQRQVWWLGSGFELQQHRVHSALQHNYFYNPVHATPCCGGPSFNFLNQGAREQGKIEARNDLLIYTSAALKQPLVIIGRVRLHANISWDTKSVDLIGRLCHVDRHGQSTNLCEGLTTVTINAQICGGTNVVEINIGSIAVLFRPGERLRLHICSSAHPRWLRNTCSGEAIASAEQFCPCLVQIHSGELSLPIESARSVQPSRL